VPAAQKMNPLRGGYAKWRCGREARRAATLANQDPTARRQGRETRRRRPRSTRIAGRPFRTDLIATEICRAREW